MIPLPIYTDDSFYLSPIRWQVIFRQPFFSFFFFFFFFFAVFKEPKKPAIVKKRNVLFITVAFYRFIEIVAVGRISRTRFWKFFPLPSPSSYVPFINYRDYGDTGKGVRIF